MTELTREQKEALGRMMVEGCKKGDPDIITGCMKRGADPDVLVQDGDSGARRPVLHWAAYHYNARTMQALIDNGANLETRDGDGDTAIMFAIRHSKVGAVETLMKNGADPVAQNYSKTVALDLARNLRADYAQYVETRDKIIKALTKDYGPAPDHAPKPADPAPDTQQDIQVLKPISLQQPKKPGGLGFNL